MTATRPSLRSFLRPRLESLEARDTPAKVGALDPSFGTAGIGQLATAGATDVFNGVAAHPDGGTVAVGGTRTSSVGEADFLIVRYKPDGSIDPAFNNNTGRATIDFGGNDFAKGVTVDPQGRIVVVGQGGGGRDFAVARLLADGRPDASFGGSTGTRIFFTGGIDEANAVGIQPGTGYIVVAGTSGQGGSADDFAVLRIDPANGNQVGATRFVGGTGSERGRALAFRPDGRVVVAGDVTFAGPAIPVVVQLSTDLTTVEKTFNGLTPGITGTLRGVALNPDGTAVAGGYTNRTGANNLFVLRLKTDLSLDPTFNPGGSNGVQPGTAGVLELDLGGSDEAHGLALDPSGRAVLAGAVAGSTGIKAAVVRVTPGGALDPSFGAAGVQTFSPTGLTGALGLALTPSGRIAVAGFANPDFNTGDGFVARLIGGVEKATRVAVGGSTDAAVSLYAPGGNGKFAAATPASAAPFGGLGVNIRTATADINGDGLLDTVAVTGPGTPLRYAVMSGDGKTMLVQPTDPLPGENTSFGGFVAAGDLDNDGRAEWVFTPDRNGAARVIVYTLVGTTPTVRANFFAFPGDPNFRGGARPAIGDVNGDGVADLAVAAGVSGGPVAALFDGKSVKPGQDPAKLVNDFFGFTGPDVNTLRDGAFVAIGDVDGDGFADLVFGGGPGGAARVFVLSGALVSAGKVTDAYASPVSSFFVAGDSTTRGGVRVAVVDADGDEKADIVVGSGDGQAGRARVYRGKDRTGPGEPSTFEDLSVFGGAALGSGVYVG